MDCSTLTFDEVCSAISQLKAMPNHTHAHMEAFVHLYASRAERYDSTKEYEKATEDLLAALKILKELFDVDAEYQMSYYDFLDDAIGHAFAHLGDDRLVREICDKYLYSMQSAPKSREARKEEKNIIDKVKTHIES